MTTLSYVMKEENPEEKTIKYGVFSISKHTNQHGVYTIEYQNHPKYTLEELAERIARDFGLNSLPLFSFEKRDTFPDFQIQNIMKKTLLTYSELSQEERTRFLTYLQRTLKGEPAKKRHNPE